MVSHLDMVVTNPMANMVIDISFLTCIVLFQQILKVIISLILSQDTRVLNMVVNHLGLMPRNYGIYNIIILLFWYVHSLHSL